MLFQGNLMNRMRLPLPFGVQQHQAFETPTWDSLLYLPLDPVQARKKRKQSLPLQPHSFTLVFWWLFFNPLSLDGNTSGKLTSQLEKWETHYWLWSSQRMNSRKWVRWLLWDNSDSIEAAAGLSVALGSPNIHFSDFLKMFAGPLIEL